MTMELENTDYESSEGRLVFPGEEIAIDVTAKTLKIGPGLVQVREEDEHERPRRRVIATRAGNLYHIPSTGWFVDSKVKELYTPAVGERVVGQVVSRHSENYRVNIGYTALASLPTLAFELATKRNRPNLEPGQIVYARLSLAHRDFEPELECVDPQTGKAGEFGILTGGTVICTSCRWARILLANPDKLVLKLLSQNYGFELAIGSNGRIWIRADSVKETIIVSRAISQGEKLDDEQTRRLIKNLMTEF